MYLNHVSIIGFLGKDPEQRKTRSNGNNNFLVLSVATQEWWKDANDERQSKTEWHRVVVFNRLAEVLGNILKKGDHVLVESPSIRASSRRIKSRLRNTVPIANHVITGKTSARMGPIPNPSPAPRDPWNRARSMKSEAVAIVYGIPKLQRWSKSVNSARWRSKTSRNLFMAATENIYGPRSKISSAKGSSK
jgi:Single-strand binding protein family